jgi:hypothetical protein
MERTHKHKGVYRDGDIQRSHPIDRVHKDPQVERWHNEAEAKALGKTRTTNIASTKKTISFPVKDGYAQVDLTKLAIRGAQITFTRRRRNESKRIELRIDKE